MGTLVYSRIKQGAKHAQLKVSLLNVTHPKRSFLHSSTSFSASS